MAFTFVWRRGSKWGADDVVEPPAQQGWLRAPGVPAEMIGRLLPNLPDAWKQDLEDPHQRPKLDLHEDQALFMLRVPSLIPEEDGVPALEWTFLGVLVQPNLVVTAADHPVAALDDFQARLLAGFPLPAGQPILASHVILALFQAWMPIVDELEELAESLEDAALESASPVLLAQIQDLKGIITRLRRGSAPLQEVARAYARKPGCLADHDDLLLADIRDLATRVDERLLHARDLLSTALENWHATLSVDQNRSAHRLTILAGLLLLPSLLAGIGGMNFPGVPELPFVPVALTLLVTPIVVGLAMLAIARRRRV